MPLNTVPSSENSVLSLNNISPSENSKSAKKRKGRGIGSGLGKTAGQGHKGQKARAGGSVAARFEGGQTPIHRRLPKFGFKSRVQRFHAEINLRILSKIAQSYDGVITIDTLKDLNFIKKDIKFIKVIKSGELTSLVKIKGFKVTKGAREEIKNNNGTIED